jgi:DNA-directed RNA polymerase subunit E'/Rpb7
LWVWNYEDHKLLIALNEKIRIRVLKETFVDAQPFKSRIGKDQIEPPYHIHATIKEDGLGLLAWWEEDDA